MSKYTIFFNKYGSLPVARKKWHDYISEDYNFFWDIFSQKVTYCKLSDVEITKLLDIYEIVYYINPKGICTVLENPESYQIVTFVYQSF